MTILKAFDHWLSESSADTQSFLDSSIQLQAFAIIVRDTVPFPHGVDMIVKCFQLNQITDPQDCIILIHQLLDKKDFYKVSLDVFISRHGVELTELSMVSIQI